jgi:hypothetical protein
MPASDYRNASTKFSNWGHALRSRPPHQAPLGFAEGASQAQGAQPRSARPKLSKDSLLSQGECRSVRGHVRMLALMSETPSRERPGCNYIKVHAPRNPQRVLTDQLQHRRTTFGASRCRGGGMGAWATQRIGRARLETGSEADGRFLPSYSVKAKGQVSPCPRDRWSGFSKGYRTMADARQRRARMTTLELVTKCSWAVAHPRRNEGGSLGGAMRAGQRSRVTGAIEPGTKWTRVLRPRHPTLLPPPTRDEEHAR